MASLMRPSVVSYTLRTTLLRLPASKYAAKAIVFHRGVTLKVLVLSSPLSRRFRGDYDLCLNLGSRKLPSHGFCVRATEVSDSGSVDSPMMQAMQNKIKEQLSAEEVIVKDAYGDGRHVSVN